MKMLDATHYRWKEWHNSSEVFDFLKREKLPVAVKEVEFDTSTFKDTDYERNGVHLSYYGTGRVQDYAAMLCDDNTIFFCVTYGTAFAGTFASSDKIHMMYYVLTPIDNTDNVE